MTVKAREGYESKNTVAIVETTVMPVIHKNCLLTEFFEPSYKVGLLRRLVELRSLTSARWVRSPQVSIFSS